VNNWPRWTLRVIGALDLLMAFAGVFFYAYAFTPGNNFILQPERLMDNQAPYQYQAYCAEMIVDLACVLLLTVAGLSVVRLQRRGLWISNAAFLLKIVDFLLGPLTLPWLLNWGEEGKLIAVSIGAVAGIGHPGTNIQIMIGYPIWALMVTNIAYHKLQGPS